MNTSFKKFIWALSDLAKPKVYLEIASGKGEFLGQLVDDARQEIGIGPRLESYPKAKTYKMETAEFMANVAIGKIELPMLDMVFLDGSKEFTRAKFDFAQIYPFVVENGFIVLYNTYPLTDEDTKLEVCGDMVGIVEWVQVVHFHDCEILTLPVFPGLTLIRKDPRPSPELNPLKNRGI